MNAYYDIANYCYKRKLNRSRITILIILETKIQYIFYIVVRVREVFYVDYF